MPVVSAKRCYRSLICVMRPFDDRWSSQWHWVRTSFPWSRPLCRICGDSTSGPILIPCEGLHFHSGEAGFIQVRLCEGATRNTFRISERYWSVEFGSWHRWHITRPIPKPYPRHYAIPWCIGDYERLLRYFPISTDIFHFPSVVYITPTHMLCHPSMLTTPVSIYSDFRRSIPVFFPHDLFHHSWPYS